MKKTDLLFFSALPLFFASALPLFTPSFFHICVNPCNRGTGGQKNLRDNSRNSWASIKQAGIQ